MLLFHIWLSGGILRFGTVLSSLGVIGKVLVLLLVLSSLVVIGKVFINNGKVLIMALCLAHLWLLARWRLSIHTSHT